MDAFAVEHDIKYVLGLQEAALMAMADGYAQASGKLAVINLHAAPGLGNAMGMLYDAMKANAPVLVTAGQQDLEFVIEEPVLVTDLPTLARPFVKWAAEVTRLEDLPRMVQRAVKTALAPPMGPVFLSLPGDVLQAEADLDLLTPTRVAPRIRGDVDAVDAAADLLAKAERPVIMAGDAVAQSGALAELAALAETIAAPVYVEFVPNSASFPASHPLYRGAMTPQPGRRARDAGPPRSAVLGRRRHVQLVAAVENQSDAAGAAADPPRHRPLADRQELSGPGRHLRRSESDAARHHRRSAGAHDRRRQDRRRCASQGDDRRRARTSVTRWWRKPARSPARRRCSRSPCSKRSAPCCPRTPWCWRKSCPPRRAPAR